MLKNDFLTLVIVLILLAAGGVFMYGNKFGNFLNIKTTPTPVQIRSVKTDEFTIIGTSFKFTPNIITVNKGNNIRIIFKDTDGPHNITFPDFKISTKTLAPNQQETIEFTADKTGTFPFYDSYAHHREFGMTGQLIIK